jgi:Uri superfamily endonuclease
MGKTRIAGTENAVLRSIHAQFRLESGLYVYVGKHAEKPRTFSCAVTAATTASKGPEASLLM